ncbi:MAG: VTT domain-containing protein [Pseudomonadota bacterium]|nr:VTT domain-containing protein [Pseudomonadota bacterium]
MLLDPTGVFSALLHVEQTITTVAGQHGPAAYAILFAIIFCEIGFLPLFFLPGDPLLFVCGALCAAGLLSLPAVILVLMAATVAGHCINFQIGRLLGDRLARGDSRWINRAALARTHAFYARRGRATLLVSPYIAVVRTFAPFVAGVSGMPFGAFVRAVLAGALLWTVGLPVAGYFLGNVPLVRSHIGAITLAGIALGLSGLVLTHVVQRVRAGRSARRSAR